jgi:hypothetical protein
MLTGSLQLRSPTFFAGPSTPSAENAANRHHNGVWRSGKQTALPASPHPDETLTTSGALHSQCNWYKSSSRAGMVLAHFLRRKDRSPEFFHSATPWRDISRKGGNQTPELRHLLQVNTKYVNFDSKHIRTTISTSKRRLAYFDKVGRPQK